MTVAVKCGLSPRHTTSPVNPVLTLDPVLLAESTSRVKQLPPAVGRCAGWRVAWGPVEDGSQGPCSVLPPVVGSCTTGASGLLFEAWHLEQICLPW